MEDGVIEYTIDGVKIRITNIARTVADCFKFRHKIGIDVAIECLKDVLRNKRCPVNDLASAARLCRVSKVIGPYIEALL
jgi:predicted transcriptional regulator of viral defense system